MVALVVVVDQVRVLVVLLLLLALVQKTRMMHRPLLLVPVLEVHVELVPTEVRLVVRPLRELRRRRSIPVHRCQRGHLHHDVLVARVGVLHVVGRVPEEVEDVVPLPQQGLDAFRRQPTGIHQERRCGLCGHVV